MSLSRGCKLFGVLLVVLSIVALAACNSGSRSKESYPAGNRNLPNVKYGSIYTVKRGDTLYSIAWAIKKDYRMVAAWNGIKRPYVIHPGQRLRMYPPSQKQTNKSPAKSVALSSSKKPAKQKNYANKAPQGKVKRWVWPTISRRVYSRFQPAAGKDGIDISAKYGDPVFATADGQVVYAGSGLRGYGQLIILKHNKTYLSAYANNASILVAEGQSIKAGKKIGKVGSGSSGKARLHFEIRKNGKPVDPAKYLSTR